MNVRCQRLPQKFLEVHDKAIRRWLAELAGAREGYLQLFLEEPLGPPLEPSADLPSLEVEAVGLRCTRRRDVAVIEPESEASARAIAAWAERRRNTTLEEFKWFPTF
jgi:hypothetical protein